MKKVLSVFLAILTIFACFSVGTFAAPGDDVETPPSGLYTGVRYDERYFGETRDTAPAKYDQVVLKFNPLGGTFSTALAVYDFQQKKPVTVEGYKDVYYMCPQSNDDMKEKTPVMLPTVTPPKNHQFIGWYCESGPDVGQTFGASKYNLPVGSSGYIIGFRADYMPTEPEEDTMAKVMNILFKVFGTIIGLLLYGGDAEAGIQVMQKIFGAVFD